MSATKDILLSQIRNGGTLTTGQQLRLCLMLSYPAILAQLSSVMMQYIDSAMVGHLGAAAGASIGLVSTCMWLMGGFGMAATSGFSVQVAHRIGANDFKGARAVLRQALVCVLGFGVVIGLLGAAVSQQLPIWLGGGPDIVADASRYFLILSLFLPAMFLDWMCAAMLQASGNMKVPSLLSIGMCLMDVVFNYLFIYKLEMGVAGAALGSGLAEVITGLLMLSFLVFRSKELKLTQERGSFRPEEKTVKKALDISGPMALQNVLLRGGYICATVELATRFAWITAFMGMAVMGFLAVLMYFFAPEMMGVMSPDVPVIELGARVLRIEAFAEVGYAASLVIYGAFVGAGDTRWPSVMNFGSMWVVRILPAIFITRMYGLVGFWVCMAVELTFRGMLFLIRLYRGSWLKNV